MTRTPPFDRLITQRGDAATLYGPDGVSTPAEIQVVVSSARAVPLLGNRGDVVAAHVASTVTVTPGQVVAIPVQPPGWYLVAKTLQVSRGALFDPGTSLVLLALPGTLTVQRAVAPTTGGVLDSYGAPRRVDAQGSPAGITTEQFVVRAGFSNEFDPLTEAVEGVVPGALETVYVPLGSGLLVDDQVTLPDGRTTRIQTLNHLYADGVAYALQGILATSVGSGYRAP